MKHLAVLILLLASCSSNGATATTTAGQSTPAEPDARIALVADDGNIALYDPATGSTRRLTTDAGPGRRYGQPTWSPDGSRLAFVGSTPTISGPGIEAGTMARTVTEAQQPGQAAIHITTVADGVTAVIETPFLGFYLYWAPDGSKLAFLGNDLSIGRQALGLIDVEPETVRSIDTGQPYYFAWSPASDRLLVHARNNDLYYLGLDGTRTELGATPGAFSAPHWVGTTQLFPVQVGDGQELTLFDADGTVRRRTPAGARGLALALSPDEERVAYIELAADANPFTLGALRVESDDAVTEVADQAAAFFWGPQGEQLLYLTGDVSGEQFSFRWNIWDGETTTAFESHTPSRTFLQQYFPFFGQYANSLTFFAPDGSSFTFSGAIDGRGEGVWLQDINSDVLAVLISDGEFSTWAP